MGTTKRAAELIVQALAAQSTTQDAICYRPLWQCPGE